MIALGKTLIQKAKSPTGRTCHLSGKPRVRGKKKFALALTMLMGLAFVPTAHAADDEWAKVDTMKFWSRFPITVTNTSDAQIPAALVHVPLHDLDGSKVAVIDPATPKPKRDAADLNFVPFQVSDKTLIFSVPLKPHETKNLFGYVSDTKLNMPGFAMGTGYDSRHAYRSFENKYAAFRMETGPGANTTGLAIDLFGKTKAGIGLRLVELYQQGHDAYHNLQYWGVDILKVGEGPGMGGIYLYKGKLVGRATPDQTFVDVDYTGPVETRLRVTAPIDVAGRTYKVTRLLTLVAEDRSIRDELSIEGDGLEDLQIGLAIRDLPNCKWVEKGDAGYAYMTGDANQPHYKAVGIGCTFDPSSYVSMIPLPEDKINGGHVYVLKGKVNEGKLTSSHRLVDVWDADGQLEKPAEKPDELNAPLEKWITAYAAERDHPIEVKVGDPQQAPK